MCGDYVDLMADIRLCFVGDSFVNGTGDRTYLGWTGRLCALAARSHPTLTYYNLGIRRETSIQIAQRWWAEVTCRLPNTCDSKIIFCFGNNDTTIENGSLRVEQKASIQHTKTLLTTAQQHYPVLMISPPPIADAEQNARTAQLSVQFAQLCETIKVPYLDVFTPLAHSALWMQEVADGDGAHPDAGGYAVFADLVKSWSVWQSWFPEVTGV